MRLRIELTLLVIAALGPGIAAAQPEEAPREGVAPTRIEVEKALDKLENDPNLVAERKVNMLRWAEGEPEAATDEPWWWQWVNAVARWFRGLFDWLAESGRYVVWVAGVVLGALLALYLVRIVRRRGLPPVPKRFVAPSHVRDLDIRPESLPDDIGAAALELWQRGQQRAALALLYRGSLSRLVHEHGVPIRASSTEGECVALAQPRLPEPSARFVARLVEVWGAAVYGGLTPAGSAVEALCGEFAGALDRRAGAS